MNQPLTVGRIVHFVLAEDGAGKPVVRPAIVVQTWSPGTANLQVFSDGNNDDRLVNEHEKASRGPDKTTRCVLWRTSVTEDPEGKRIGSWHWPPRSP